MTISPPTRAEHHETGRDLRVRLLLTLVLLAALVFAGFATLLVQIRNVESLGNVVDMSGRQRALSTRIHELLSRQAELADPAEREALRQQLDVARTRLANASQGLREGNPALGLPAARSESIRSIYEDPPYALQNKTEAYLKQTQTLASAPPGPGWEAELAELSAQRDHLVAAQDVLTRQFADDGRSRIRQIELAAAVVSALLLISLAAIWVFNFRPMQVRISKALARRNQAERELAANRDLFALFVAHVPVAVVMFDQHMNVLLCSQRWLDDHRLNEQDVLGRSIYGVIPDISAKWVAYHQRGLAGEQLSCEREKYERPNGNPVYVRWDLRPWRTANGDVGGIVLFTERVTEQVEAEERLRLSEKRYRELYNKTPVMLHSIDAEGRLVSVSDYWLEQMGYLREEVLGRPSVDFVTAASRQLAEETVMPEFFASGSCAHVPYEFVRRDGTVIETDLSAIAEYNDDGTFSRSLAVIIDVTERNRAEEQLRQKLKMEAVGQLTAGIAHDFNNLLAVVQGNMQLIERVAEQPERVATLARKSVDIIRNGAKFTRQLLTFARRHPLKAELTDVNELIASMQELLERTLGPNVRVETDLATDLGELVIDKAQLESALINLAINARDAMPGGGTVTFRTYLDEDGRGSGEGHWLCIEVSDTGEGVPDAIREQIFEPFFTTKEVGRGTGLGLSVVHGFVQQSGGRIQLSSSAESGSVFQIRLPRHVVKQAAAHPDASI